MLCKEHGRLDDWEVELHTKGCCILQEITPQSVDEVLDQELPEDDVLQHVRSICRLNELPAIEVSVQQGKLLELLVRTAGAETVLEVGTLGGYSTICLARGTNGPVTTLEYEPKHVFVARANLSYAGYSEDKVLVIEGDAHKTLEQLVNNKDTFDFIFIDADKESNEAYFKWADKLGSDNVTIVVDNVIRDGRILDPNRPDKLAFIESLGNNLGYDCTVVQTVGSKGWDGFVLAKRKI